MLRRLNDRMRYLLGFCLLATVTLATACKRPEPPAAVVQQPAPVVEAAPVFIQSAAMAVTVEAMPAGVGGAAEDQPPPRTATVVVLRRSTGPDLRFTDDVFGARPTMENRPNGAVWVTFNYQPEDEHQLLGRDLRELETVSSLGVRFDSVLGAMGLVPTTNGVVGLKLDVNGVRVVDARPGPPAAVADSSAFKSVVVANHFANLTSAYRRAAA